MGIANYSENSLSEHKTHSIGKRFEKTPNMKAFSFHNRHFMLHNSVLTLYNSSLLQATYVNK